jgi:hypothetical protein
VSRTPDFLIIGAAKSATSWLTRCLIEHPDVIISSGEVHYFSWHYEWDAPLPDSYLARFAGATANQICGENSNTYLSHPLGAQRIHGALPEARLIVSLRNPVDRAYSDWAMRLRQQYKLSDMFRFLDPDHAPDLWYLHKGLYFEQLAPFLKLFKREQIHFLLMEDMQRDPQEAFGAVCRFLGVEDQFEPTLLRQRVNAKDGLVVFPHMRHWLHQYAWGRALIGMGRNSALFPLIKRLLGRTIDAPPLPDETRRKLKEFYRKDVLQLSNLLDRDLAHWVD